MRCSFYVCCMVCMKLSSFFFYLFEVIRRNYERKTACKAMPVSIRCEQNAKDGNGLDVWLGRVAMVGFAVAITVEVTSGKGLLEVCFTYLDLHWNHLRFIVFMVSSCKIKVCRCSWSFKLLSWLYAVIVHKTFWCI